MKYSHATHTEGAPDASITEARIFCWGSGAFGQHGHIIDDNVCAIDGFLMNPSVNVEAVFCGAFYTFALKGDGTVLGWGNNQNGQLGCSHQRHCLTPTRASIDAEVVQVSAGDKHSLFLLRDGTVRGCGCNFYAQLSVDALEEMQRQDRLVPVSLSLPDKVKQVACGQYHSLLLCSSGDVVSVGRNVYGQLGVPMPEGVKTDVLETPAPIEGAFRSPVARISAGQNHSIAIDDAGRCYAWGYCRACGSRSDHLFKPKLLNFLAESASTADAEQTRIARACGGSSHSLFLSVDGSSLFALGCNLDGQCGFGERVNFAASPTLVDLAWVSDDGRLASIDAAENFSCAITASEGELWMWGRNSGVLPAAATRAPVGDAESSAPRVFEPRRVPVPFAVLSVACGNWHAAAVVDYKAPKDVSHLPDGRSSRQPATAATAATTSAGGADTDDAWVDIVSNRTEKPSPPMQPLATPWADGFVVGCDPLALEDIAANDDGDQDEFLAHRQPPPASSQNAGARPMRRTKSLNRVPASTSVSLVHGGNAGTNVEARQRRAPPQLRRVLQPASSPVTENSELVRLYRLDSSGSGRPGAATYQNQPSASNGPPQLQRDRGSRPPTGGVGVGRRHQLLLLDEQLVDYPDTGSKPPLPAPALSRTTLSHGAVGAGVKQGESADRALLVRLRTASAGATATVPAARNPISLPVRQNRASLRRMSSAGRLGNVGDVV